MVQHLTSCVDKNLTRAGIIEPNPKARSNGLRRFPYNARHLKGRLRIIHAAWYRGRRVALDTLTRRIQACSHRLEEEMPAAQDHQEALPRRLRSHYLSPWKVHGIS